MALTNALFYPFHLCHERTLHQLLANFSQVHFRDYMAIQVSPFFGTTAYPDRMGDTYPDLCAQGRLVQGYPVSGALSEETIAAVNRDLSDSPWRDLFHNALLHNHRFQKGLFAPLPWASFLDERMRTHPFTHAEIRNMSRVRQTGKDADAFDYGLALLKTSAALVYTVQLAAEHRLAVATDSPAHFALLARTAERDRVTLENFFIERPGY
jgi:hypothetical protein